MAEEFKVLDKIRENVPLAPFSTYRTGGVARWFLAAGGAEEIALAINSAKHLGLPVFILGGGSNLLIDDEGFQGLVVKLGAPFGEISFTQEGTVEAGGGARLKKVGRLLTALGYADFLFMTGIPGTVGGAVRMNAGTREGDVSKVCIWVEVLAPDGEIKKISAEELSFGYRSSRFSGGDRSVILKAAFRLGEKGDPAKVKEEVAHHLKERRAREPRIKRNCGSFFKALPDGTPAGLLIEKAGLKGVSSGGAMVAFEHANWLLNTGKASSADIKALARLVEETVYAKFGQTLVREVIYVPDDL